MACGVTLKTALLPAVAEANSDLRGHTRRPLHLDSTVCPWACCRGMMRTPGHSKVHNDSKNNEENFLTTHLALFSQLDLSAGFLEKIKSIITLLDNKALGPVASI